LKVPTQWGTREGKDCSKKRVRPGKAAKRRTKLKKSEGVRSVVFLREGWSPPVFNKECEIVWENYKTGGRSRSAKDEWRSARPEDWGKDKGVPAPRKQKLQQPLVKDIRDKRKAGAFAAKSLHGRTQSH